MGYPYRRSSFSDLHAIVVTFDSFPLIVGGVASAAALFKEHIHAVSAAGAVSADEVAAVPADDLIHRIGAGIVAECADVWESVAVFCDGCFDVHGVVGCACVVVMGWIDNTRIIQHTLDKSR